MKKIINKFFGNHSLFTALFVGSFSAMFTLFFLGAYMNGREIKYQNVYDSEAYRYYCQHRWYVENVDPNDVPKPECGNLSISFSTFIKRDNLSSGAWVDFVIQQNEPMKEKIKSGEYPSEDEYKKEMCVVIGEGLLSETYKINGNDYITIGGLFPCRVTGVLEPYFFPRFDTRCIVFTEIIPDSMWNILEKRTNGFGVNIFSDYELSRQDLDLMDSFYNEIETTQMSELFVFENYTYENTDRTYSIGSTYGNLYFCVLLLFLSVNMMMLSSFWSGFEKKEWVVKRVCGFSRFDIICSVFFRILVYEIMALVVVFLGILVLFGIRGTLSETLEFFSIGSGYFIWLFLAFSIFSSIVPVIYVFKLKPANVLKYE